MTHNTKERSGGTRLNFDKKTEHMDYEHKEQLNMMLKVIHQCPMPQHLKIVMRSRLWGMDPNKFNPLTAVKIAFMNCGGRRAPTYQEIAQIEEYESQGKFHCQQFLLAQDAQEIVSKFNENEGKNKDELFSKHTFIQKKLIIKN